MCNYNNRNEFNNQFDFDNTTGPNCRFPCRCVCEFVNEIVELCNAECVIDTLVFKDGYQIFENGGLRGVTVNCGISVKYIDCKGCRRTAVKDVTVVFINVPNNIFNNFNIHICNPPKTNFCNNAVSVEFTVALCERSSCFERD